MEITIERKGQVAVMYLKGEISLYNVRNYYEEYSTLNDIFGSKYEKEVSAHGLKHMVINMNDVIYLDSTAISALVHLYRLVKDRHGELKICSLSKRTREIFKSLNMDMIFDIYQSEEGAIESFQFQ